MVAIIDYDAGNMKSVEKALRFLGKDVVCTKNKDEIISADHVILPGVGAFGMAMEQIRANDLEDVIHTVVDSGTPFMGICLGEQLLFEKSEESPGVEGLGILKGEIKRIPVGEYVKIPHMGWNSLSFPRQSQLFKGIEENSYVYFVHSYYVEARDYDVVAATCNYNVTIHAAVESNNVFGCQFHPEKSSTIGLKILNNFVSL